MGTWNTAMNETYGHCLFGSYISVSELSHKSKKLISDREIHYEDNFSKVRGKSEGLIRKTFLKR